MEPETIVVHAAQALHNARLWDSQVTEITFLLSSRQSVVNVVHEQDHAVAVVGSRNTAVSTGTTGE